MLDVIHARYVVIGMIPLLERQFWQWVSALASMASRWKSSYFWPISCTFLTKRSFKMIADLDRKILKIV